MITKLSTTDELEKIFTEILINKTEGKVNKISPNSVLSGIASGVAGVAQKNLKEVALIESINFPDSASGDMLDQIADKMGISPRYGASESTTYIRLVADEGTIYQQNEHQFITNQGITFQLEAPTIEIGEIGYTYAKVRSVTQGLSTNVNPFTINQMDNEPTGHQYVINEYRAIGGRDIEDDLLFRRRIKEGPNILARGTLAMLEQALNKINSNVLRVFYYGLDVNGKVRLAVSSVNGIDFNQEEFDEMLEEGEQFFSLTELRPFGTKQTYGINFVNVDYQPIDVSFRVDILQNANLDQVLIDIQTRMSKLVDFRKWKPFQKVDWDDLLEVAKNTRGVRYIPDQFFNPRNDIIIDQGKLPRFRSFIMMDLDGDIIIDQNGNLNPIFYPSNPDVNFQSTVLRSINA